MRRELFFLSVVTVQDGRSAVGKLGFLLSAEEGKMLWGRNLRHQIPRVGRFSMEIAGARDTDIAKRLWDVANIGCPQGYI